MFTPVHDAKSQSSKLSQKKIFRPKKKEKNSTTKRNGIEKINADVIAVSTRFLNTRAQMESLKKILNTKTHT